MKEKIKTYLKKEANVGALVGALAATGSFKFPTPVKDFKNKIKGGVKKLLLANLLAGAIGGAAGTLGASYLLKDKKKNKKKNKK